MALKCDIHDLRKFTLSNCFYFRLTTHFFPESSQPLTAHGKSIPLLLFRNY